MIDIDKIHNQLKYVNFRQILDLSENTDEYNFEKYILNHKTHSVCGFCTKCENLGVNFSTKSPDTIKLMNISHGSHSLDFISAMELHETETVDWHNDGVMFVMENPSNDYGIYESQEYNNFVKRPSKIWYWIHDKKKKIQYPDCFKGKQYGTLVCSIITTFRLKNAYLTNLVKCGMNDENGNMYRNLDEYNVLTIETCLNTHFENELRILEPKVIFVFGRSVYNNVVKFVRDKGYITNVYLLPHPARQRQGFTNSFYKVLYFNIISKALFQNDIINDLEAISLHRLFLES